MLKFYAMFFAALVLLSGCALTNEVTPLYYQPNVAGAESAHGSVTLSVGKVTDSRGVVDARMIDHKVNMSLDSTSGMYLAEMPIADIISYGLETALSDAGYKVVDKSRYMLTSNLLKMDFQPMPEMFSARLQGNILVEFALIDKRSGTQIWEQTYHGFASVRNGSYRQVVTAALNNLFVNLLNSSEFRNALH